MRFRVLLLPLLMLSGPAQAAGPGERAVALPAWFSETFLDLREDVRDAAKTGKRLMVYSDRTAAPIARS